MSLKVSCTLLPLGLVIGALAIVTASSSGYAGDVPPLKITAEIISQKYCPTYEADTIMFKLRIKFVNQTDRKLIVDKNLGRGPYDVVIAADAKSFSDEHYEYAPFIHGDGDAFFADPDGKEPKENLDTPEPNFLVLTPGTSVQREIVVDAFSIGLYGFPASRGALKPGDHVLGVWLNSWQYRTKPEGIHKQWESIGDLLYKSILVGPVPFNIPPIQKIEKCEQ
jgi:hypothetical protein